MVVEIPRALVDELKLVVGDIIDINGIKWKILEGPVQYSLIGCYKVMRVYGNDLGVFDNA